MGAEVAVAENAIVEREREGVARPRCGVADLRAVGIGELRLVSHIVCLYSRGDKIPPKEDCRAGFEAGKGRQGTARARAK